MACNLVIVRFITVPKSFIPEWEGDGAGIGEPGDSWVSLLKIVFTDQNCLYNLDRLSLGLLSRCHFVNQLGHSAI